MGGQALYIKKVQFFHHYPQLISAPFRTHDLKQVSSEKEVLRALLYNTLSTIIPQPEDTHQRLLCVRWSARLDWGDSREQNTWGPALVELTGREH